MSFEKQEIKVNESIKVILKTHTDYDYEPDFMGTFGREVREWCIDRKLQVLLGEAVDEPEWPERSTELRRVVDNDERILTSEEYDEIVKVEDEYHKSWNEWDRYHGLKVLSTDVYVYHRYDSGREYRYFYPIIENYQPSESYTPTLEEQIKWCLQDHKRMEELMDGSWCYLGYEVEVWVEGIEVASESLWGIESDMDRASKEEVWGELLDQCFSNIEKKISDMVNALQRGFSALPSKETIADLVKEIE